MNLSELVRKVDEYEKLRGFSHETTLDKIPFIKEEAKEFIDAIEGNGNIADEGADMIISTVMVLNREGIDPAKAIRDKIEKDRLRV